VDSGKWAVDSGQTSRVLCEHLGLTFFVSFLRRDAMPMSKHARSNPRVAAAWLIETDDAKREVRVVPARVQAAYVWLVIWPCVMAAGLWWLVQRELLRQDLAVLGVFLVVLVCAGSAWLIWHRQQGGPMLTVRLRENAVRFDRLGVQIPFERILAWRVERDPNSWGDSVWFNLDCDVRAADGDGVETIAFMVSDLANSMETLAARLRELTMPRAENDAIR
jgi:hypothetical protein